MIYLKSFLVAICGAIVGAVLWILVSFVLPVYAGELIDRIRNTGGVGSASISSSSIFYAACVGFVVTAWWARRRFRTAP